MDGTASASALQVFDLGRMEAPDGRDALLRQLRDVARDTGFFYLTGHGFDEPRMAELLALARRFFALPEAEKLAVQMVHSPHFRGYNRAGAELTRERADWREQFDINSERPALPFDPSAPPWTRLQGPNQWPAFLPELRPALLNWQAEMTAILTRLLRVFALALDLDAESFAPLIAAQPNQLVKIIRYPGRGVVDDEQGVGAHKDSDLITILLQDRQAGLQVETAQGWLDVPPLPGTFVINIGEQLELATSGYLRATVHRVVAPPPGADRISAALFLGSRLDAVIEPLALPPALAAAARGITRDPQNPLYPEVGRNYLKGRLRSHPDVAQKYHADLLAAPR